MSRTPRPIVRGERSAFPLLSSRQSQGRREPGVLRRQGSAEPRGRGGAVGQRRHGGGDPPGEGPPRHRLLEPARLAEGSTTPEVLATLTTPLAPRPPRALATLDRVLLVFADAGDGPALWGVDLTILIPPPPPPYDEDAERSCSAGRGAGGPFALAALSLLLVGRRRRRAPSMAPSAPMNPPGAAAPRRARRPDRRRAWRSRRSHRSPRRRRAGEPGAARPTVRGERTSGGLCLETPASRLLLRQARGF